MTEVLSFRLGQAIYDLLHIARQANPATLRRICAGVPGPHGQDEVALLLGPDWGRFHDRSDPSLRDAFALAAALPDEDAPSFQAATAVLLANLLQGGPSQDDLRWYWDAFAGHYRTFGPAERAAVMGAFRTARDGGLIRWRPDVPDEACLCVPAIRVLEDLLPMLHALHDTEISAIASAAPGNGGADFLVEPLRHLVQWRDGMMPGDHPEDLAMAVRAAALMPGNPGFFGATAIVLINTIMSGDVGGWLARHWCDLAPSWRAVPGGRGAALVAALRYLHQSDPDFPAIEGRSFDPRLASDWLIPWHPAVSQLP